MVTRRDERQPRGPDTLEGANERAPPAPTLPPNATPASLLGVAAALGNQAFGRLARAASPDRRPPAAPADPRSPPSTGSRAGATTSALLQRQPKLDPSKPHSVQVGDAMKDGTPEAIRNGLILLNGLSMRDLLVALAELFNQGHSPGRLIAELPSAPVGRPRLHLAIRIVEVSKQKPIDPRSPEVEDVLALSDSADLADQKTGLQFLEQFRAMPRTTTEIDPLLPAIAAVAQLDLKFPQYLLESLKKLTPIRMPAMPGRQFWPFYIGQDAHSAIAQAYRQEHPGEAVFTNRTPISTILRRLRVPLSGPVNPKLLEGQPDILNASRNHLYEIKSWRQQGLGLTEVAEYLWTCQAAGLAQMQLGPASPAEAGTYGVIGGPGGMFLFWAPVPGLIIYVRKAELPKELEEKAPEKSESKESAEKKSEAQKMVDDLGIGVAGWIIVGIAIVVAAGMAVRGGGRTAPAGFPVGPGSDDGA